MHTPPDPQRRWASPESPLGRAAAAIRHLLAGEAGEEDILAAELTYQGAWDAYRRGEFHPTPRRGRPIAHAHDRVDRGPR